MRFVPPVRRWFLLVCLFTLPIARGADLASQLAPLIADHDGEVAIAVKHLERGEAFEYDATAVMPTASLIKFPVMVAAYRLADAGTLDLNRKVSLRDEDKVPGSGILTTHFSPGAQISVRDAIRLMIAYSDNTATNLVLDQIGLKTTADMMEQLGFPDTKIHAKVFRGDTSVFPERSKQYGLGSTTPQQIVQLLEKLHRKELASAAACESMFEHLLACEDKDKIPRDLPAGTKVAHKTGSVTAVRTAAGIILSPSGPIALCIMTADNEDKRWHRDNAAEVLCGRVARVVYDHFNVAPTTSPTQSSVLQIGSNGPLVESLQRALNARLSPSPELSVDGEFGPVTREAVVRFQREHQLRPTGEVDPGMWKALGPVPSGDVAVPDPQLVNGQSLPRARREDLSAAPLATCKAWAIADANTGVVLWGHRAHEKLHFASTTKIMTAYIVLRLAEQNPAVLNEEVVFSERADKTGGSSAELRAGEKLPVSELLYGLMLPSGNDASVALAEHFGARLAGPDGDSTSDPVDQFVAEMNRTAQSLGMLRTQYRNPHGLTHDEHLSTAADLIVLAQAARQIPRFREYVNTRQRGYTVSSVAGYTRNVLWKNTNQLLGIDGYNGVKTGTTDAAGACLVSAGERDGDELLVVVLGSANSDARYVDSRNLFRWAWRQRVR